MAKIDEHLEFKPGARIEGAEYPQYATKALLDSATPPAGGWRVGEIRTAANVNYHWNGAEWVEWHQPGTVTRENITGVVTLDVAGHVGAAAELTLSGDVTALTFTGWAANTTEKQTVRVKIVQDATGGHVFDWAATEGVWSETLDSLSTIAVDDVVQFDAVTLDGGSTISLEPVGVRYSMNCLYMQTVTASMPAIQVGEFATISHSFSVFGDVVLIDSTTGRRVLADWRFAVPGDICSSALIDFDAPIAPFNAGDYVAVAWGQASQPCALSVSASKWESVSLPVVGANTITPRFDFAGNPGDVQIVWGDGTVEDVTTGAPMSHTYGASFSGDTVIRWRPGVTFTRINLTGDPYDFNISRVSSMPNTGLDLTLVNTNVTGDVSALGLLNDPSAIWLSNTSVVGDIAAFASHTNLRFLVASQTGVYGDVAQLSGLTALERLIVPSTTVSGDLASLSTLTVLEQLLVQNTLVTGSLDPLFSAGTSLELVQAFNTTVTGDIANLATHAALRDVRLNLTGVSGNVAALAANTALTDLFLGDTATTGAADALAAITTWMAIGLGNTSVTGDAGAFATSTGITSFSVDNTLMTGDPAGVAAANPGLSLFEFFTMGTPPTQAQLDQVITSLAAGAVSNGTLSIAGTNPAITNVAGIATLTGRGWVVTHN